MAEPAARPNIRIQITNELAEAMDVDENDDAGEEGEIIDSNDTETVAVAVEGQRIVKPNQRVWPNSNGGFSTGINIFDKVEQSKLVERAKRFALNPNEIRNFTDEQLQELHDSLGITTEDEKDIRFEALHVRGTDEMSTEEVIEYFGNYGPSGVEWINDESCNVVWDDKVSAARALFFLSRPIKGMPIEGPCDPFAKELVSKPLEDKENGKSRSVLLKEPREVELREDSEDGEEQISVSDITVPIPPGYWRLGVEHLKSKFILLRFSLKSDKKHTRAEKFSCYYKKYGNPNYGGLKGLISETHKKRFKGILARNNALPEEQKIEDNKNPWGALAMNWNEGSQFCEKEVIPINNSKGKSDVMSRIGSKRPVQKDEGTEETGITEKRAKMPRMRMYADEEEEKIKRKKELQKIKQSASNSVVIDKKPNIDDLRAVLKSQNRKYIAEKIVEVRTDASQEPDLGLRLKNRTKNITRVVEEFRNVRQNRHNTEEGKEKKHGKDDLRKKHYMRRESPDRYSQRMRSDDYDRRSRRDIQNYREDEEKVHSHKPRSKVAVVIKTQKAPAVASTVWSRINTERDRLKTVPERKLRRDNTPSDSESSDDSSSSSGSSKSSLIAEEFVPKVKVEKPEISIKPRPGFQTGLLSRLKEVEHRSPLRIEINNDQYKKE